MAKNTKSDSVSHLPASAGGKGWIERYMRTQRGPGSALLRAVAKAPGCLMCDNAPAAGSHASFEAALRAVSALGQGGR